VQCQMVNGTFGMSETKNVSCNPHSCPVPGNWTEWTAWSTCTASCGLDVSRNRSRACENPAPQHGGLRCPTLNGTYELNEDEFQNCNLSCCEASPTWSEWGDWGVCNNSIKCGNGTQHRNKTCITSDCLPVGVRNECQVSLFVYDLVLNDTQPCKEDCVVENGTWSAWTVWSNCSTSCGTLGQTIRTRTCEGILNGGFECVLSIDNVTRGMNDNQTRDCFYYCSTHYDCLFNDNNFCNFTLFQPTIGDSRWQIENGNTNTYNTGPSGPQEGTHYGYFESSVTNGGGINYHGDVEAMAIENIPAVNFKCLVFYHYSHQTSAESTGEMGYLKVDQILSDGTKLSILNVNFEQPNWLPVKYNITDNGNPYKIQFEGQAFNIYTDHGVDNIRFYPDDCATYDANYKPVPT